MAYATSDSSGTGASTSSGRSSPDELHALRSDSMHHHTSHAFPPFGASFPPRRSSTPATAFLPPRFWQAASSQQQQQQQYQSGASFAASPDAHGHLTSGNKLQQVQSHSGGEAQANHHNTFVSLPRRTSFGTVFGNNRLSAFTALGISPHSPYLGGSNGGGGGGGSGTGSRTATPVAVGEGAAASTAQPALKKQSSHGYLAPHETAISSAESTPAPSMPSSPVQRPQKTRTVYLPGPDGICVESRSRRRSDAAR